MNQRASEDGKSAKSVWHRVEAEHRASNREMARLWPYLLLGVVVPGLGLPLMDAVGFEPFQSLASVGFFLAGCLALGALFGLVVRLARVALARQQRD